MSKASVLFGGGKPPALWVTGTTYAVSDVVLSPSDKNYYTRIVAGAGSTDPSADGTNWRSSGANGIKSIQRGVASISGAASGTSTISSVDMTKTELRYLGFTTTGTDNQSSPKVALTNSTTITATIGVTGSASASWELTERY